MALCLANSLIARREFNPYDQLVRYHWWHIHGYMSSTGQCFDIGSATRQSLQEFAHRQKIFSEENNIPIKDLDFLEDLDLIHEFNVYCSQDGVAGNGALMRLAPVPLFFYKDPVRAVEFSGISGKITHGDQKAYDACRYYGALIVAALNRETKEQLLDKDFYLKHIYWFNGETLHTDIMNISQGSYQKQGGYDDGIRGKGYIVDALEAALWAFWSDENSFKKGALAAVNLGDDTDTTAAIYGQLAGAYYGYHNLPSEWLEHVYAKKFIDVLCKWIAYEGQKQKTENISKKTISTVAKAQDDQKITPPTTPIDTKPHDDQEATPPTTPTVAISQNDQKITSPTTPIDTKPHDDQEATPPTIPTVAISQNDQEITSPTTPIDTKPHDDQEATPPATPTVAISQDDQKITPPTTPTVAISQDDHKITPPTTPIDIKPHSDQETSPPTTPTDAKPQEDQKATPPTTPTVAISQNDQEITPPTTPQNNLTTVPSSSETLHSDLHTTYKHTEASEFSAKKFDRIPTDEPPYEYESYRSDPTYYSSSISKESPPILKTIETRSDTRTRNIWENIGDNRPFSSESTSYASPTNKRKYNQSE
jgi:ADP-ribosylglycohydrolase